MSFWVAIFTVLFILTPNIDKIFGAITPNQHGRPSANERFFFFGFGSNNIDQSCECGLSNTPKIVGGTETIVNEFPWMVYLQITTPQNNQFLCGGVLITDRHILTAGHCAVPGLLGSIRIVLGDHNRFLTIDSATAQRIAQDIILHPLYNLFTRFNYDFAILNMDSPVTFTTNIRPICLPEKAREYTDLPVTVLGWGRQQEGGPGSAVLLKANLTVASRAACIQAYRDVADTRITSSMMCAGSVNSVADACEGDSGGPLMYKADSGPYVSIGVISFGTECGRPGTLSVHARVDRVLKWIRENTRSGRYCTRP